MSEIVHFQDVNLKCDLEFWSDPMRNMWSSSFLWRWKSLLPQSKPKSSTIQGPRLGSGKEEKSWARSRFFISWKSDKE